MDKTVIEQIQVELHRIIGADWATQISVAPAEDTGYVIVDDAAADCGNAIVIATSLLTCLRLLPAGCPLEEGVDGSLWEVVLGLPGHFRQTLEYIAEHHGVDISGWVP